MSVLLPNGSIVLLRDSSKRVMIYGRLQREVDGNRVWDYIACLYPEGNINADHSFLFDNEQIENIYFVGYQDEEEIKFQHYLQELSREVKKGE